MRTLVPDIVEEPLPVPAVWKKGQPWYQRYSWLISLASVAGLTMPFIDDRWLRMGVLYTAATLVVLTTLVQERKRKATPAESEALARRPGDAWLMQISVSREWSPIGTDRGIVHFGEHALIFEGERCSFCIGTQDISDKRQLWSFRIPDGSLRDSGPPKWMVRLKGYAGGLEVDFIEIKAPADKRWFEIRRETPKVERKFYAFDHALEAFLADKEPTSLPRVYPPVTP